MKKVSHLPVGWVSHIVEEVNGAVVDERFDGFLDKQQTSWKSRCEEKLPAKERSRLTTCAIELTARLTNHEIYVYNIKSVIYK